MTCKKSLLLLLWFSFNLSIAQHTSVEKLLLLSDSLLDTQPNSSLQILKSVDPHAIEQLNDSLKVHYLFGLGKAHDYSYQMDSGQHYNFKALALATELGYKGLQAKILFNIGTDHLYTNNLDSAIHYFMITEKAFLDLGDSLTLSKVYNNLGILFRKTRNYSGAISTYKKSLNLKKQLFDSLGIINSYLNLSYVYLKLDSISGSFDYANTAYDLSIEYHSPVHRASALSQLGHLALINDEISVALKHYLEAESIMSYAQDVHLELTIQIALGETYTKLKNMEEASFYLNKVKKGVLQLNEPELCGSYYQAKSNFHEQNREYKSALHYNILSYEKQLEIREQDLMKEIKIIEKKYETAKQKQEIAELAAQNKEANLVLLSKDSERNLWITISAFLVMGMIAGFSLYLIKQRLSKRLKLQNLRLDRALTDKEMLMKEIHHRTKNNLQMVSSLLKLKSNHLENTAKDAYQEGRQMIKSMAIIHQKLYHQKTLTDIVFSDYLEELKNYFQNSYAKTRQPVQVSIESESLRIDIDTAIPLGLIANELMLNAFKHAYCDLNKCPELLIKFQSNDQELKLEVQDNGVGFDSDNKKSSFGMQLIDSLLYTLKGNIKFFTENGTRACVTVARI